LPTELTEIDILLVLKRWASRAIDVDGWVMRVGELLRPITAAMGQELLSGSICATI